VDWQQVNLSLYLNKIKIKIKINKFNDYEVESRDKKRTERLKTALGWRVSNGKVEAFAKWGPFFMGGWLAQSDPMGPMCRGRVRKKEERLGSTWVVSGPTGMQQLKKQRWRVFWRGRQQAGESNHTVSRLGGGVDHIEDPESTCKK